MLDALWQYAITFLGIVGAFVIVAGVYLFAARFGRRR